MFSAQIHFLQANVPIKNQTNPKLPLKNKQHMSSATTSSSLSPWLDESRLWRDPDRWQAQAWRLIDEQQLLKLEFSLKYKLLLEAHINHCCALALAKRSRFMSAMPFQDVAMVRFLHIARAKGLLCFRGKKLFKRESFTAFRVNSAKKRQFGRELLLLFGMTDESTSSHAKLNTLSDAWQTIQESFWYLGYRPDCRNRHEIGDRTVWCMAFSGELDFVPHGC
jgi:hypothetical protein